ncbi:MAG: regulator [Nitrospirota bacterium]|nr:regulator [Nitrospirota bacterium]
MLPLVAVVGVLLAGCDRQGGSQGDAARSGSMPETGRSAVIPAAATASAAVPALHPRWTQFELNTSVHAMAFQGDEVWVGTEGGLLRYNQVRDEVVARYDTKSGLLSSNVMAVEVAPDGGMWVGTHGGGLTHVLNGRWTHTSVPRLGDPFVYQVLADVSGKGYWVATWSGLSHFDGKRWNTFHTTDGLADDWVYAMAQDKNGTLWLGTEGGVSSFDGKLWHTWTHSDGLGAEASRVADEEPLGNPSRHHRETPGKDAEGPNPNYVLSAAIDRDGNKWFGTWGAGLSRFDGKSWQTFTRADGLAGNFVTDLYADADGTLWATSDGGVSLLRNGRWQSLTSRDGLISDSVFALAVDGRGRKWFGTMAGISRLDGLEGGA